MTKVNMGTWTENEDMILTGIAITYIRDKKKLYEAWQKASEILNRTEGACSHRWNSVLSKNHNKMDKKSIQQQIDFTNYRIKDTTENLEKKTHNKKELDEIFTYFQEKYVSLINENDALKKELQEINQDAESYKLKLEEAKKEIKSYEDIKSLIEKFASIEQ